ncbi:MAG TPA: DNA primase, partial [Bacillota bacterium]|nr:DNA primase [Bacillota bacterium]
MEHQQLIQEIKEKNNIADVISEYVTLKRAGRSLIGLCPFHNEKTPSFNVNPDRQFFYCFGCGAGGDVISFIMKVENLDFMAAAKKLAERAGISWQTDDHTDEDQSKTELYKINKLAAYYYNQCLLNPDHGKVAQEYLNNRGINQEIWSKFNLGYALPGWTNLTNILRQKNVSLEKAEKLGLLGFGENSFFDRFRERIIFPIFDPRGNICGFGGRIINNNANAPKYLNSPESSIFHKGQSLYGIHLAKDSIRREQRAIFVEGNIDVLQAHQAGFTNTVASLGTALTLQQAKLIKRYAPEAILAYDADAAGQKATVKGLEILREAGLTVKIVILPEGEDPDSLIRKYGPAAFKELLDQALNFVDYRIKLSVKSHDLKTTQGKAAVVNEIIPIVATLGSSTEIEEYVRKLSREIGVSETSIFEDLKKWRLNNRKKTQILDINYNNRNNNKDTNEKNSTNIGITALEELSPLQKAIFKAEKELLQIALQEYDKFERIKEELRPEELYFEPWRELFSELLKLDIANNENITVLEEISSSLRETAASLVAELQIKDYQTDVDGLLNRIAMLRLQEKIQILTTQISLGRDEAGKSLTDEELKQKIKEFTELKKKLQKEFPNFTGEL